MTIDITVNFDGKKILCLGAGYVGASTMAVISQKCPTIEVTIADVDQKKIDAWNSSRIPIYEPGLKEIVFERRGKNLFFSSDIDLHINRADIIFIAVGTPTKKEGIIGTGSAADLTYVEAAARQIARVAKSPKIVVEKSTVPVRAAEIISRVLSSNGITDFEILSNPEFLAEGTAIADLDNPDRVLIGGMSTESGKAAVNQLASIYGRWVPKEKIVTTSLWSSELSKLVANAFLAQRISSINSISALCEKAGADVYEVSRSIGFDSRIGNKFLQASVGFGGSCFQKDILNLVYLCENFGLHDVAKYWSSVVELNDYQKRRFSKNVVNTLFSTVRNKKLAIFGFAFKKDTSDTRESPAIYVCRDLLQEGANICIYDPEVSAEQIEYDLGCLLPAEFLKGHLEIVDSHEKATQDAHAILVMTEWDEFKMYDYTAIHARMMKPAFVFDGRGVLRDAGLAQIGFETYTIGVPRRQLADLGPPRSTTPRKDVSPFAPSPSQAR